MTTRPTSPDFTRSEGGRVVATPPPPAPRPPLSTQRTPAGGSTTTSTQAAATSNELVGTTGVDATGHIGLPAGAELWRVDNRAFMVWFVPTPDGDSFPIAYEVPDTVDLASFFGTSGAVKIDRYMTDASFDSLGALHMGLVTDIPDIETTNPFDSFLADYEAEMKVFPWLEDPEILAIHAAALLEGRVPTDAELMTTEWWRTKSEAERAWLLVAASDPATAAQHIGDAELTTRQRMEAAGIYNPAPELVSWLANKFVTGQWTETQSLDQIRMLADPLLARGLDPELATFTSTMTVDTTRAKEDQVRTEIRRWLGPMYGDWSDDLIGQWASRVRNDPDGMTMLTDTLRGQRLAIFNNHANPDLTYEDIAAPMRRHVVSIWGRAPDETDPFFSQLVNTNDYTVAGEHLRRKGLADGVSQVVSDATSSLNRAVGPSVRPL